MIDFLKSWSVNIAALVILIALLEIIVPSGKLKKIISLVSGFVLIIAIMNPILTLLKKGDELRDFQITQTAFLNQKDLEVSTAKMSKEQTASIITTYKNRLAKDIEGNVKLLEGVSDAKAKVIVEENPESKEYGMIKSIAVNVKSKEDKMLDKPVIAIKKIEVNGSIKEANTSDEVSSKLTSEIRSKLIELYKISSDQVAIGKM